MTKTEILACLNGRPCDVCKFHTENGCKKWNCVFEEKSDNEITNGEIISEFVKRDDSFTILVDEVNGTVNIELSLDFWNAPYEADMRGKA